MAEQEIPTDIMNSLENCFPPTTESETFSRIVYFLSDALAGNVAHPYIRSLQAVIRMPGVFKSVANRMAEDTKTAEKDPQYKQLMYDVWDNFLKDNLSPSSEGGQNLALAIPRDAVNATAQYAFIRAVSRLTPEAVTALHGVVQSMSGRLARYTGRALVAERSAQPVVKVALVAVFLAIDIIMNIKRWWKGEITGKRCVKNIIDNGVSVAAGLGGAVGGEWLGASVGGVVGGPLGMAVGAVAGGIIGGVGATIAANVLCDRLTQWVFGLPKTEALEHAYNFLAISPKASNSDINSRYRHLSLKYHPDKGGNRDDWTRLQYSMAVIREARGEA